MNCEVLVNGKPLNITDNPTLIAALKKAGITQIKGIALAINGDVVPQSRWSDIELKDKDSLLIVSATQGG